MTVVNEIYISRVDQLLTHLRGYLLGLDTRLNVLLPLDLKSAEPEETATYLADRLLFCLATGNDFPEDILSDSWNWLYEASLYLLRESNARDHDLANILKMFSLPLDLRETMLYSNDISNRYPHLKADPSSPVTQTELETAMLRLVPKIYRKEIYEKLNDYLLNRS